MDDRAAAGTSPAKATVETATQLPLIIAAPTSADVNGFIPDLLTHHSFRIL
jgi:hypothetical protein